MKTELYNQLGEVVGEINLPDSIFGVAMNADLLKQVLDAQSANSRQLLAHAKDRGEVRGGGRKPWRQKGTGRARHASIRSPIWEGGGVTFGPAKEKSFKKKINKKMKRGALFMALSSKFKDKELLMLDGLKTESPKTKSGNNIMKILSSKMHGYRANKKKADSILLVIPKHDETMARAFNNLPFVEMLSADSLNTKDILANKYMILIKDAVPVIEKTFRL